MATFEIENGVLGRINLEDNEDKIVIPEGVTTLSSAWSFSISMLFPTLYVRFPSTLKSFASQFNWFTHIGTLDFGLAEAPFNYPIRCQYDIYKENRIMVDPNNKRFKIIDGVFVDVIDKILYREVEDKFIIPDFVEKIEEYAFKSNIETIETGSNLKIIEKGAFFRCPNLKKLVINGKLEKISGGLINPIIKPEIVIHISSKLKKVGKKPFDYDLVKEIYFDSDRNQFAKNPFIIEYLSNSKKLDAKVYFLDENNDYVLDGTMEKYSQDREIEKIEEPYITDEYSNKYYVKNDVLYKFEGNGDNIVIPKEIKSIGSRVFSINSINNLYLFSNITEISNGAFLQSFVITNLYYDGNYSSFNKIVFSYYGGRKPLLTNVKHIFVKDENNQYYEVLNGSTKMVESRGASCEFIKTLLTKNNDLINKACKELLKKNKDDFVTYFRYYENRPSLIMETSFSSLTKDIQELLVNERISFITDDLIINYSVDKNTKINMMRSNPKMTPIKPSYGNNVINGDDFVRFDVDLQYFDEWNKELPATVKVDIPNDIKKISLGAFKDVSNLYVRYSGTVKEWLNIDIKDDLKKHSCVVLADDGVVEYVDVKHEKSPKANLYYGYAWMGNQYLYALQFFVRRKDIWGFIDSAHKAIISSHYFVGANLTASNYDEDSNTEEYSILDFHNFKCIGTCDVEAG